MSNRRRLLPITELLSVVDQQTGEVTQYLHTSLIRQDTPKANEPPHLATAASTRNAARRAARAELAKARKEQSWRPPGFWDTGDWEE